MFPVLFACLAAGCGGDDDAPLPQTQVTVLDRETGRPVAGAEVTTGDGAATTDAEGVASVSKASELSISHAGYLPLEVSGGGSDALVLPLTPSKARQRTVRGSIVGWDALPALEAGHYRMAKIRGAELNDAARIHRRVVQGISDANCVARNTPTACAFELNVHSDVTSVFAVIVEGDDAGTPEDLSDDTLTGTGFGLVTFDAGDDLLSGQQLQMIPADQLGQVAVKPGVGTGSVSSEPVGVPGLTVNHQVLVFPAFEGELDSYAMPVASALSGGDEATLWGVSLALDPPAETRHSSFAVERGLPLDLGVSETVGVDVAGLQDAPQPAGSTLSIPQGQVLFVQQDSVDYIAFGGSLQIGAPTISSWIQLCEAAGFDAQQALASAPRCSAAFTKL
ncbi:MAG: hypothetical protein KC766_06750 [Myxococcales bacterium]|nr:hypothetical protein [Myxococcales bacterium]